MSDEWHEQERPAGSVAFVGEAGMGAIVAIALQAGLTALLISAAVMSGAGLQQGTVSSWLGCAACSQFVWLLPAFLVALWWRPGFAGGLAGGAMFGAVLGLCLACLAAI